MFTRKATETTKTTKNKINGLDKQTFSLAANRYARLKLVEISQVRQMTLIEVPADSFMFSYRCANDIYINVTTLLTCRNSLCDVDCSVFVRDLRTSMNSYWIEKWLAVVKLPILIAECRPQSSAIAHLATSIMQHLRLHKTVTVSIHLENYRFANKRNISPPHRCRRKIYIDCIYGWNCHRDSVFGT